MASNLPSTSKIAPRSVPCSSRSGATASQTEPGSGLKIREMFTPRRDDCPVFASPFYARRDGLPQIANGTLRKHSGWAQPESACPGVLWTKVCSAMRTAIICWCSRGWSEWAMSVVLPASDSTASSPTILGRSSRGSRPCLRHEQSRATPTRVRIATAHRTLAPHVTIIGIFVKPEA